MDPENTTSVTVLGGQWGDEGKGKVVDLLSAGVHAVVRYNGGHNAGHTVKFADRHFALHLVPSGVIHPGVRCYMGAGMVVDPTALLAEIDDLEHRGVRFDHRLMLSGRAAIILPTHQALDGARERARGEGSIGTTGRGIGPTYQDLAQRRVLRAYLLKEPHRFAVEASMLMEAHNRELELLYRVEPVDVAGAAERLEAAAARLAPLVGEVGPPILEHVRRGDSLLFEGAQGIMLDLYQGTYPFVTSSSCLPGAAAVSCGVPVAVLGPSLAVMKGYVTRVGGGPFPTELSGETGNHLRDRGHEFGTTTGRPRRCGWFDAVAARYAARVAGLDGIALMKLDVLDDLEELRIAVEYRLPGGGTCSEPPDDPQVLATVEPVYETLPGWRSRTAGLLDEKDLPARAAEYIRFIEERVGAPIVLVSTGPRREETLTRGDTVLARRLAGLIAGGSVREQP